MITCRPDFPAARLALMAFAATTTTTATVREEKDDGAGSKVYNHSGTVYLFHVSSVMAMGALCSCSRVMNSCHLRLSTTCPTEPVSWGLAAKGT